jgi:hypothetical protein
MLYGYNVLRSQSSLKPCTVTKFGIADWIGVLVVEIISAGMSANVCPQEALLFPHRVSVDIGFSLKKECPSVL